MKKKVSTVVGILLCLSSLFFLAAGPKQWLKDRAGEVKEKLEVVAKKVKETGGRVTAKVRKDFALAANYLKQLKEIDAIDAAWQKFGTPAIRKKLNRNNLHRDEKVIVQSSDDLSSEERAYLKRRQSFIAQGYEQYFGEPLEGKEYKLAFVGSGGGYRAMILTMGYAKALEDLGLLDATTYFSSLSGSTWFLAPWIFNGGSVNDYRNLMVAKILDKRFNLLEARNLLRADMKRFVENVFWKKFVFGQPIGMVDLYGALLAYVFLQQFGNQRQAMHLSAQQELIADGSKPFPIYTAVSMHKIGEEYLYNWYAFDPFYVTNLELNKRFKSFAFNSSFSGGKTKVIAPEQSMGFLLGIFGSAFEVNIEDLYRIAFEGLEAEGFVDTIKLDLARLVFDIARGVKPIGKSRMAPAQVYNPFAKDKDVPEWFYKRMYITLVDAGIDYNLPVRPVMVSSRGVQYIIIGDSSASIDRDDELQKMFADLKRFYGYTYERIDDDSNTTLRLYQDKAHEQAPRMVYINFLKDDGLLERGREIPDIHAQILEHRLNEFDVVTCVKKDFCGTFNFDYGPAELNRLFSLAYVNAYMNLVDEQVKEFIKPM